MLTPQEIETKQFDKTMFGYKTIDVQMFMAEILEDYEKLHKENAVLKSKITVLADKVEEYRKVEESLRNALLSAQRMGENIVKEANTKSDIILSDANSKAQRILNALNMEIIKEKQRLIESQRETEVFKARTISLLKGQIALLGTGQEMKDVNIEELSQKKEAELASKNTEEKESSPEVIEMQMVEGVAQSAPDTSVKKSLQDKIFSLESEE